MTTRRRCLGCGYVYPVEDHACPKCGSHAGEVETTTKPKRAAPRRKA
jgi:rRNA maturation endonuclease Nob1